MRIDWTEWWKCFGTQAVICLLWMFTGMWRIAGIEGTFFFALIMGIAAPHLWNRYMG